MAKDFKSGQRETVEEILAISFAKTESWEKCYLFEGSSAELNAPGGLAKQ